MLPSFQWKMKPLLSTWPTFMPRTIPGCTTETLDAPIMGRVSSSHDPQLFIGSIMSFTLLSLCADNTQGGVMRAAEKHSHMGSMKVSLISCLFIWRFFLVCFSFPENDLVPFSHLVSTCHGRISAWTLATAQKSLCTLAAVCSLLPTSWQRCGPRTRSLC